MRRETLFKRLAEKTNYPLLEKILLGEVPHEDLTMDCLPWTGAKMARTSNGRVKSINCRKQGLRVTQVFNERQYGVINWQKKQTPVHRVLFLLLYKPSYEFKMANHCGTPLCVNPLHFEIREVTGEHKPPPISEIPPMPDLDDPWSPEEVEEIVEMLLDQHTPTCWEDVISRPMMEGVPHDMVREYLTSINKGHLT